MLGLLSRYSALEADQRKAFVSKMEYFLKLLELMLSLAGPRSYMLEFFMILDCVHYMVRLPDIPSLDESSVNIMFEQHFAEWAVEIQSFGSRKSLKILKHCPYVDEVVDDIEKAVDFLTHLKLEGAHLEEFSLWLRDVALLLGSVPDSMD